MKQVTPQYPALLAVCMLLLILFLPPHHHHGGTACFADDVHATHEGTCTDPEHHCDDVPDAADPCMVFLQSSFVQSFKDGQSVVPQHYPAFDALFTTDRPVLAGTESRVSACGAGLFFVLFSPVDVRSRRGPPVWG